MPTRPSQKCTVHLHRHKGGTKRRERATKPGLRGQGGARRGTQNTAHTRLPRTPTDSKGGTANGVVHTLQTGEDRGPPMPAEIRCSEIWSCACGEGMGARAGYSVIPWRGRPRPAAAR